jgi:hypothetical protein
MILGNVFFWGEILPSFDLYICWSRSSLSCKVYTEFANLTIQGKCKWTTFTCSFSPHIGLISLMVNGIRISNSKSTQYIPILVTYWFLNIPACLWYQIFFLVHFLLVFVLGIFFKNHTSMVLVLVPRLIFCWYEVDIYMTLRLVLN